MDQQSLDQIGITYIETPQLTKGKGYRGGDKTTLGKGFTRKYDQLFSSIRDNQVVLLELGVLYGRSIAMWSDYFPNGQIHGLDVSTGPFERNQETLLQLGAFKNKNVVIHECDLRGTKFKEEYVKTCPSFDIIIDDAIHESKDQYNNFMALFPKLKPNGFYIIEDIVKPVSFMQHFGEIFGCVAGPDSNSTKVSRLGNLSKRIESIEMVRNIVIIKKIDH